MIGRIESKHRNLEFLLASIKDAKTVEDTYILFSKIQDYLEEYNVQTITYRNLFDNCMDKYRSIQHNSYDREQV